jgi:hypothetical protein
MANQTNQPRLARPIEALLAALRRRIRRYVWLQGIALCVAWLGAAFWISLVIDQPWMLEPPPWARGAILALVGLGLAGLIYRMILRRAFVRFGDRSLAVVLERRFEQFNDSLLTAVELADQTADAEPFNREMFDRTCRNALELAGEVRLAEVFNPAPLRRSLAAACLLGLSVLAFAAVTPERFGIWARRDLMLSPELWPRKTALAVEGFSNGVAKVARGADLAVIAKADTAGVVPGVVEVRYRTEEGARGRVNMVREGVARRGVDKFQNYSHAFQGILLPIEFDLVGGDDRVTGLRIEVVESPTITRMTLDCEYPAYMKRPPRSLPWTGTMPLARGTRVRLRAQANKDLVRVRIDELREQGGLASRAIDVPSRSAQRRAFEFAVGQVDRDRTFLVSLEDADGIRTREPFRLTIASVADEPPQVAVRLEGIGSAVTPKARLPLVGQITDDYGVGQAWLEYEVDQKKPEKRRLAGAIAGQNEFAVKEAFELGDLVELKPGQKLRCGVTASDTCDLAGGPHVAAGERYLLEVVTPQRLREILEARELVLRERYEAIIQEVRDSRDSLARIDLAAIQAPAAPPAKAGEKKAADKKAPGAEPENPAAGSGEGALALATLRVQRAVQNSRKNAQETLGVATAFDEICEELVNNRVDTVDLRSRLKEGIAEPLKRVARDMFPLFERRLETLQNKLSDPKVSSEALAESKQQAVAILLEMERVLEKMLKQKTWNEMLARLRLIIDSQEKVLGDTQQRRKERLRDLIKE